MTESASLKHLRKLYIEKFVESTSKRLSNAELQESFGDLKDAMDAKSFNIFMSMVKEKVEGLKPYAQAEFEGLCAEFDLNAKFRQVEDAAAAASAAPVPAKQKQPAEQPPEQSLAGLSAEDLARHRRMAIKKKELKELKQMEEREAELFQGAEETLTATKNAMKSVYHDLSSISPDAQKLLQRCAEN